jgi:hypothetical protein
MIRNTRDSGQAMLSQNFATDIFESSGLKSHISKCSDHIIMVGFWSFVVSSFLLWKLVEDEFTAEGYDQLKGVVGLWRVVGVHGMGRMMGRIVGNWVEVVMSEGGDMVVG